MPLMFADPTNDKAFKRLFGEKAHASLTVAFLNEILGLQGDHTINSIIFTNTEKNPRYKKEKRSYIDIYCKDQLDREFIIEMQSSKERHFAQRAQYYIAQGLSRQLEIKGLYGQLMPVIFVGILDFHLFNQNNQHVVTHHKILDIQTYEQTLDLMEFHFVELPKFKKTDTELVTDMDKWIYFFKKASELDTIPTLCVQSEKVKEAFDIMERSTWTKNDWIEYEARVNLERYWLTQEAAEQEEHEQLLQKKKQLKEDENQIEQNKKQLEQDKNEIEQNKKELEQDKKELEQEKKQLKQEKEKAILNLLKLGIALDIIAQSTGFSIDEIKALQENKHAKL